MAGVSRYAMDWTDLEMFMRALEGVHGGKVEVTISPVGISSSGGVNVAARHLADLLPNSELPNPVEVTARFPSTTGRSMIETVYDLLWKLDWKVGNSYKQKTLMDG